MKLQNKVVVITGSGGGIGEASARRFAAEGAKVVVTDVDDAAVKRVAGELGTVGVAGDITTDGSVRRVADLARETYGEIDMWFSNAGIDQPHGPGELVEDSWWTTHWELHVMAHVRAAREVLPAMIERGDGYLLQTASQVALAMHPQNAPYTVSKHAALSLSEWLAAKYRPQGIKVSCFCPGPMLTPMLLSNGYPPDDPIMERAITAEQVAELLVSGVDAERFLIVESDMTIESLATKAADYDGWIDGLRSR